MSSGVRRKNQRLSIILSQLKPIGFLGTVCLFGVAAVLLWVATHLAIPYFSSQTSVESIVWWFIFGGFGVLVPLVVIGFFLLKSEGAHFDRSLITSRLRFRRMSAGDWYWGLGGLLAVGIFGALLMQGIKFAFGDVSLQPSFMSFKPLSSGRYWILAAWLPFWILNIMGEEFLWRGVLLPRQEIAFGKWAWLVNGSGWLLFHIAFGPILLITLLPIVLILPFAAQHQRNSWVGVLIHAGLNGPAFIAIALGLK